MYQNGDRRAIYNATRGIDAGRRVICHRGVSDGSDGARPLGRRHSAWTEMFFADDGISKKEIEDLNWSNHGIQLGE